MQEAKPHLLHLDVLKGVMICLVVVGHAFHFGFEYYRSPLLLMLRSIDMPIFLFLSGMLGASTIQFDRAGVRSYWSKKSRQLLLPLITLPTLYALLYKLPAQEMIWGMMHGGYWFTLTLFEMFALLFCVRIANHYLNREGNPWIELAFAILSLAFVLLIDAPWKAYHLISWEALSWGKMNYLYYYFLLGYFAGRYEVIRSWMTHPWVHVFSGLIFVLLLRQEFVARPVLSGIPTALVGLTFAYATAFKVGSVPSALNRFWAYLGKESRTIYLTHYLFLFSVPFVKPFLVSMKGQRVFAWEVLCASLYAAIVIMITLMAVRFIKSSDILNTLCYGKALRKMTH